jgi:hypothetical protein
LAKSGEANCYAPVHKKLVDYAVSKNTSDDEIGPSTVTPPRSEGSVALGSEMLRCAQHDRAVTHTDAWINVFMCIVRFSSFQNFFSIHKVKGQGKLTTNCNSLILVLDL